jgi:outer membrane lipoprotein-sorting protein
MRALGHVSLVATFLVLAGALRADDQADARAILDKAARAMGGEEKLAKFTAGTVKCKIVHEQNGQQFTIVGEGAWQGHDKMRLGGDLTAGGNSGRVLMVINGNMGWAQKGGQTQDAPEGLVTSFKQAFYAIRMPQFLPSLKDKAYTLAPLGEQKIEDREAVGLTIGHKDHQDVRLHFDKETGLPIKSETRMTDPVGKEFAVEFFYSDYKDTDGGKQPMKITLKADGNEFVVELSEIQPKDKVDDSEFAKP